MDEMTPLFNTEDDLFSFETDQLALRGNKDYCDVLKTLVILAAQRERALKDYKTVAELRVEALNDPVSILEKIKNGCDLGVPPMLELAKLPIIDFKKYNVKVPESDINEIYSESQKTELKPEVKNPVNNRVWSPEEQKRLEELLQTYPPEPIEMRRFQKIAKALGNRTVHQVASRVQKYFLKLFKAGLPIPGRIPKSGEKHRKSLLHKHQRHNHYLWKPTTFFPELNVPVQMDELESIPGPSNLSAMEPSTSTISDNYLLRTEYHQSFVAEQPETHEDENQLKVKLLKRVREVKAKEVSPSYIPFSHIGYKCDYCEEDPLNGTRWHCTVCPDSIDFCTDCVISQIFSESPHSLTHWLADYKDDSENYVVPTLFAEPAQMFDKQISDELKNESLEISDNEDFSE